LQEAVLLVFDSVRVVRIRSGQKGPKQSRKTCAKIWTSVELSEQ